MLDNKGPEARTGILKDAKAIQLNNELKSSEPTCYVAQFLWPSRLKRFESAICIKGGYIMVEIRRLEECGDNVSHALIYVRR